MYTCLLLKETDIDEQRELKAIANKACIALCIKLR